MYYSIAYVSGVLLGFQKNWAKLTMKAYTIYMTFKNYLTICKMVKLLSNVYEAPLENFIPAQTVNSKVKNYGPKIFDSFMDIFEHLSE